MLSFRSFFSSCLVNVCLLLNINNEFRLRVPIPISVLHSERKKTQSTFKSRRRFDWQGEMRKRFEDLQRLKLFDIKQSCWLQVDLRVFTKLAFKAASFLFRFASLALVTEEKAAQLVVVNKENCELFIKRSDLARWRGTWGGSLVSLRLIYMRRDAQRVSEANKRATLFSNWQQLIFMKLRFRRKFCISHVCWLGVAAMLTSSEIQILISRFSNKQITLSPTHMVINTYPKPSKYFLSGLFIAYRISTMTKVCSMPRRRFLWRCTTLRAL